MLCLRGFKRGHLKMILAFFLFFTALGLAVCAGIAHIIGLQAILSGLDQPLTSFVGVDPATMGDGTLAFLMSPVIIIGIFIEFGKLSAISVLSRYWKEKGFMAIKVITVALTLVALVLTSAGVYGFLSKANIGGTLELTQAQSEIPIIEAQIEALQRDRAAQQRIIENMDAQLDRFLEGNFVSRSEEVRREQAPERERINERISEINKEIANLRQEIVKIDVKIGQVEAELGPAKMVAEFLEMIGFYAEGQGEKNVLKIMIFMIVLVLDPMAMVLLIWAQTHWRKSWDNTGHQIKGAFMFIPTWFEKRAERNEERRIQVEAKRDEELQKISKQLEEQRQHENQIREEYENKLSELHESHRAELDDLMKNHRGNEDDLKESLDVLKKELEVKEHSLQNELDEKQRLLSEREEQLASQADAIENLHNQLNEKNQKLEDIEKEKEKTLTELEQVKTNDLASLKETHQKELDDVKNELQDKVKEYEASIQSLEQEKQELANAVAQLDNSNGEQAQKLQADIDEKNKELENLAEKIAKAENDSIEIVQNLKQEHEKEIKDREEEYNSSLSALTSKYEQKVLENQKEREKLSALNQKIKDEYEKKLKESNEELEKVQDIIETLENEIEGYKQLPKINTVEQLLEALNDSPKLAQDLREFILGQAGDDNSIMQKASDIQKEILEEEIGTQDLESLDYTEQQNQEDDSEKFLGPKTRIKPDPVEDK